MKKKLVSLLALGLSSLALAGCYGPSDLAWLPWVEDEANKPGDFDVQCKIYYAKDGDKKELFDTTEFAINTKIYVCVDFVLRKTTDKPVEGIDFKVQIPYAEYYSTKEYYQGTIQPKENPKTAQDLHGNIYTIMELTDMTFILDDQEEHPYYYIFEIEANQVCDNAEFITRFEPENRNLSVSVNKDKEDNSCRGKYSFHDAEK